MDTLKARSTFSAAACAPPLFREAVSDAIRYWEPRRIGYNLILGAIFLGWVMLTWPHFRYAFTRPNVLALFVFAVLANACYRGAYLVDLPTQYSAFWGLWRRWRWALWVIGVVFAGMISFYWIADEIYPSVV